MQYNVSHNLLYKAALLVASIVVLAACAKKEKLDYVPESGQAKYEIHYSSELRNNALVGAVLPDKVTARFNRNGLRFNMTGKLNTFTVDIVATTTHSFFAMKIDNDKYLIPLSDVAKRDDAQELAESVEIVQIDSLTNIGGWMSKSMNARQETELGTVEVEAFYVPIDADGRELADMPIKSIPGLITAMKIAMGETEIMFSLNELSDEEVLDDEFAVPTDYETTTPEALYEELQDVIN